MALVPGVVKRRFLTRALFGGGPLTHLLALAFQPTIYLRRMSMRRGILGPSSAWRAVGIVVYGGGALKKFLGRQPEVISTETLRPPQFVNVLTATPLSRKEQKRTGITRAVLQARAEADVAAARGVEPAS